MGRVFGVVHPVLADQRRHVGHDQPGRGVGGPCLGDEGGDADGGDDDVYADGDEQLWLIHEKCDDYGIDDPEAGDRIVCPGNRDRRRGRYTLSWRISGAASAMIDRASSMVDPWPTRGRRGDAGGDGDVR